MRGQATSVKFLAIILALIFILFCISSCQRQWNCYGNSYLVTAIKGTDTISIVTNIAFEGPLYELNTAFTDSVVNYYKNSGYNVTLQTTVVNAGNQITDKGEVAALEDNGETCIESK
jgi:hypothetical protein